MSTGPISMQSIADRITATVPGFELVGRAADMEAALKSRNPVTPAAYVILGADVPGRRVGTTQRFLQPVRSEWSVVVVVRDYRASELDAAAQGTAREMIGKVRANLLGWKHPEADMETELAGRSEVVRFANGVLWWEDVYSASYQVCV